MASSGAEGDELRGVEEGELDAEIGRALSRRLLAASPTAEFANVALAILVAVLLVGAIPSWYAVVWALGVVALAVGRMVWRRRAVRVEPAASLVRRGVRGWVAVNAAWWGLGTAWLTAHASFALTALVLLVLAGLVGGAMVTLLADQVAFQIFVACLLGPPVVGLLAGRLDHDRIAVVVIITVFAGFQVLGQRRAYLAQLARERTKASAVRQREQLRESLSRVKLLSGLLPICAGCKKIRDSSGAWQQIEEYVGDRSEAEFSHGLCPECLQRYYGMRLEDAGEG